MPRNRLMASLGLLMITALVLAACGAPAQAPQANATQTTETSAAPTTGSNEAPATESTAAPAEQATLAATEEPTTAAEAQPDTPPVTASDEPYRVGIFSDLTTVNYWSYLGPNSSVWNAYVLSPQRVALYGLSDKRFELIPAIATELPERPLEKEGEFFVAEIEMRPGINWSDGTPLTAKDVAFTANTALELQLPGNWAGTFDPVYLDHVEAVDDNTVKFVYNVEPGLAVHEWGALQGPILSEAYWRQVVEQAKTAVDALTPPAEDAPQEEQDAYQEKLNEALNVLYSHEPNGEPLAGAFTFGKWEKGAFVENQANPDYYQKGAQVEVYENGAYNEVKEGDGGYTITTGEPSGETIAAYTVGPHTPSVVYTIYGSQDAAVLALKNGEIDYFLNSLGLQAGLQAQLEGQEGLTTIRNPINGYRYLSFNMRKEPMNDVAFRQAVATLIDKEFVTNQILQGAAFPVYTFISEGNTVWASPDVPKFGLKDDGTAMTREERVNKAIEILEAAGYKWEGDKKPSWDADNLKVVTGGKLVAPSGKPLEQMELLAPGPGYDPLRSTFAIWIEQWLNEFGIPVKANLTGFNILRDQVVVQQQFDMYILGWSLGIFPNDLQAFFHSSRSGPGDLNSGGYSNPEFDKQADQILTCTTFDACKQIAADLQKTLGTELPYVVLFETGIIEAYRSDTLEYPYTDTLSGIQYLNGMPATVKVSE